jgi:hypothetical protein
MWNWLYQASIDSKKIARWILWREGTEYLEIMFKVHNINIYSSLSGRRFFSIAKYLYEYLSLKISSFKNACNIDFIIK